MRILVTGGAGFIGSHIVEHFQGAADIRVLDNLSTGRQSNLAGLTHEFIQGSVTDRAVVRRAVKGADYVFHLAALISVPESMEKPIEYVEANTVGTLILLEEAARARVKRLCFSSSAALYGDNPTVPKTENMIPEPKSPYAVTKLDGEHYCRMFHEEGRLQTVCLRYFNVFGPRQDPSGPYAAAVPIFIDHALKNKPLTIFGDGGQTRDFVYVKDVTAANAHLAAAADAHGVYNTARGGSMTINELARTIVRITESRSEILHAPGRPGDVRHSQADVSRLESAGFSARTALADGLRETVAAFSASHSRKGSPGGGA